MSTVGVGRPNVAVGPPRASYLLIKRTFDLVTACALLFLLSPLMVGLWVAVRLSSSGPGLFRQERVGRRGKPFQMLKFRSMHVGTSDAVHRAYVTAMLTGVDIEATDGLFKLAHDPRVTRLGEWLRKTSLDELPQLINVVTGRMSLVGPRPLLVWEAELLGENYRSRFEVLPGMTGLWQVKGRNRLTMSEQLDLDLEYVRTCSTRKDLALLMRTPLAVASSRSR